MPLNYFTRHVKFIYIETLGALIIISGTILGISIFYAKITTGYEYKLDYTDCLEFRYEKTKCKDVLSIINECHCFLKINVTQPMKKTVTAYYELEPFYQSQFYSSRDNKQLSGELSNTVSEHCKPYAYVTTDSGRKPIAPCGELADRMFNDTLTLQFNNDFVPKVETGLIPEDEKKLYRNPSGNPEAAFKDYAKPINWRSNIWELDEKNSDNNGFQNEAFIAWMNTDWTRKPLWTVNHTGVYQDGLPEGEYVLRVNYAYPSSVYSGRRYFIISNKERVFNPVLIGISILLLFVGLIIVVGKIFFNKKKYGKYVPTNTL